MGDYAQLFHFVSLHGCLTESALMRHVQSRGWTVDEAVQRCNDTLSGVGLQLRVSVSDVDAHRYWTACNVLDDALARESTAWTKLESAAFRKLLDAILRSPPPRSVTWSEAVRLCTKPSAADTIAVGDADALVRRWVDGQWFQRTASGQLAVGPRCGAELRAFLEAEYVAEDVVSVCALCRDPVYYGGRRCASASCSAALHDRCVELLHSQSAAFPCPACLARFADAESQ